jgi:hypothetical protein
MAVYGPLAGPGVTVRTDTVLLSFTRYTYSPGAPVCTADVGTSTAFCSVSTSSVTLTNSLGNSASLSLGTLARSVTVPVAVAIWLLMVYSSPVASCFKLSLL